MKRDHDAHATFFAVRRATIGGALVLLGTTTPIGGQTARATTGDVKELTVPSKQYPAARRVWLYTPAGYPASCRGACNMIVAFDGSMYLGAMFLPTKLDSLIAGNGTPPTVAVLVDNGAPPGRTTDLANSHRFATFVGDELVPWVRNGWTVTRDPTHTIIMGSSAGGLAAAYIAFQHPDLFGNVLSQSGAFWRGNEASNDPPYEWLTQQYGGASKKSLRLFLDVGALETTGAMAGAAPSLVDANRHLRAALTAKGYAVDYFEVPGGDHSPESWRGRLATGIAALAPVR